MKIQVMGAGAWGIALARHLSLLGHDCTLWGRDANKLQELAVTRVSPQLLPGVVLPEQVQVATTPDQEVDFVLYAVPSRGMKDTLAHYSFPASIPRISAAKGIEQDSLLRMSERIEAQVPGAPVLVLSGPSHAEEVGRDLPTCLVVAGKDPGLLQEVQLLLGAPHFRVYTSRDVVGVELGGALKNVIALAAGACAGFGLGDNARAALITRGLAEMKRLGLACGAEAATFAGLSGLGDLVVSCASMHSRNYRVGLRIAEGAGLDQISKEMVQIAEGVGTAQSARSLARRFQVDMPIVSAVYDTLFEGLDAREAITGLLARLMKSEWES